MSAARAVLERKLAEGVLTQDEYDLVLEAVARDERAAESRSTQFQQAALLNKKFAQGIISRAEYDQMMHVLAREEDFAVETARLEGSRSLSAPLHPGPQLAAPPHLPPSSLRSDSAPLEPSLAHERDVQNQRHQQVSGGSAGSSSSNHSEQMWHGSPARVSGRAKVNVAPNSTAAPSAAASLPTAPKQGSRMPFSMASTIRRRSSFTGVTLTGPVHKTGWLVKRSVSQRIGSNWKTRFFSLYDSQLVWSVTDGGAIKGAVVFDAVSRVEVCDARDHCLALRGVTDTLLIAGMSAIDASAWCTALSAAIAKLAKQIRTEGGGHCGFLRKRSSGWHRMWKQKYFRLVGGGLVQYRTEIDATAQGVIRLDALSRCAADSRYTRCGFVLTQGMPPASTPSTDAGELATFAAVGEVPPAAATAPALHLEAGSIALRDTWVAAINAEIGRVKQATQPALVQQPLLPLPDPDSAAAAAVESIPTVGQAPASIPPAPGSSTPPHRRLATATSEFFLPSSPERVTTSATPKLESMSDASTRSSDSQDGAPQVVAGIAQAGSTSSDNALDARTGRSMSPTPLAYQPQSMNASQARRRERRQQFANRYNEVVPAELHSRTASNEPVAVEAVLQGGSCGGDLDAEVAGGTDAADSVGMGDLEDRIGGTVAVTPSPRKRGYLFKLTVSTLRGRVWRRSYFELLDGALAAFDSHQRDRSRGLFLFTPGTELVYAADSIQSGPTDGLSFALRDAKAGAEAKLSVVGDDGAFDGDGESTSPAAMQARVVLVREAEQWVAAIKEQLLHVRAGTQRASKRHALVQHTKVVSAALSSTGAFGSGGASAGYDDEDAENGSFEGCSRDSSRSLSYSTASSNDARAVTSAVDFAAGIGHTQHTGESATWRHGADSKKSDHTQAQLRDNARSTDQQTSTSGKEDALLLLHPQSRPASTSPPMRGIHLESRANSMVTEDEGPLTPEERALLEAVSSGMTSPLSHHMNADDDDHTTRPAQTQLAQMSQLSQQAHRPNPLPPPMTLQSLQPSDEMEEDLLHGDQTQRGSTPEIESIATEARPRRRKRGTGVGGMRRVTSCPDFNPSFVPPPPPPSRSPLPLFHSATPQVESGGHLADTALTVVDDDDDRKATQGISQPISGTNAPADTDVAHEQILERPKSAIGTRSEASHTASGAIPIRRAHSDGDPDVELDYGFYDEDDVQAALAAQTNTGGGGDVVSGTTDVAADDMAGDLSLGAAYPMRELDKLGTIGAGESAVVRVVAHRPTGKRMALKVMNKQHVVRTDRVEAISGEAHLHKQLCHPGICRLLGTAQDTDNLYLLLELLSGGELYSLLYEETSPITGGSGGMGEHYVRFFSGCVSLALSFLHSLEPIVLYRDLKTENIVLDAHGYPKLVDFGNATRLRSFSNDTGASCSSAGGSRDVQLSVQADGPRTFTLCGSPDYAAPEMHRRGEGYGIQAEHWAFGVLLFEMLTGELPFSDDDPMVTIEKILDADIEWPREFCTNHPEATDLILRLLEPDTRMRLGCKISTTSCDTASSFASDTDAGFEAISQHKFFAGVEWDALLLQTAQSPYTPAPLVANAFAIEDSDDSDVEQQECFDSEEGAYYDFKDF